MLMSRFAVIILPLFCLGFVWKNPCTSDLVLLQKVSRKAPTRLLIEGKNVISAVEGAFVYNTGYKRITILTATPDAKKFIRKLMNGDCTATLTAVIIPDPHTPNADLFTIHSE